MTKKILLKVNSEDELAFFEVGFILGVAGYSVCFEKTFSVDEIKKIKDDKPSGIVIASLNRLIFDDELDKYRDTLLKLDGLGLDGIIVSDVAALTYNLKTNIIIEQSHLNNNYLTINHYTNNGVSGIVLTNDITNEEISNIKKNVNTMLYKQVFGLCHLSTSVRKLVSNYLEFSHKESNGALHFICEPKNDNYYYIFEDYYGTHILSNKVLNLLGDEINADFLIIDSFLLDKEKIKKVVLKYQQDEKQGKLLADALFDTDDGFSKRKTIYKVKNNE